METRWYGKSKEEQFFYKIGCNAKRSFVLRQGKNGRDEWHDSLTGEILGWQTVSGNYMLVVLEAKQEK